MTVQSNNSHRLIHEPLLHFLVLGAGLFLLYAFAGNSSGLPQNRIVVDEAQVGRLAEQFQRTWMRPPTREELAGLAEDFVKEEILYREAVALGLDKDDLVIRRRMRQKMEFLNADLVEQAEPTDAELQAYLDANPTKFERPQRFSFQQIYVDPERHSDDPEGYAAAMLARIAEDPALAAQPQSLGDPTLLPPGLNRASAHDITSVFGVDLTAAVLGAERGVWSGPYRSSYGLHLLHLVMTEPGSIPSFAEVRPLLEREWYNARRQEASERFHQALRARYSVEIRLPPEDAGGDNLAARIR